MNEENPDVDCQDTLQATRNQHFEILLDILLQLSRSDFPR